MIKLETKNFILIDKFIFHYEIKNKLLQLINDGFSQKLELIDSYYSDSISRLDWDECKNFQRPWVQFLIQKLKISLDTMANNFYYDEVDIQAIWFQQYLKKDSHGWHMHSENYTGVYYLQFPEGSPNTELVDQEMNLIIPNIKEGDILLFPSFLIHRAPKVQNNLTKTIISFNINFKSIKQDFLQNIKK